VNFLRRLALQEEELNDSSRPDVVEIAPVALQASELLPFLFALRTYAHPATETDGCGSADSLHCGRD